MGRIEVEAGKEQMNIQFYDAVSNAVILNKINFNI